MQIIVRAKIARTINLGLMKWACLLITPVFLLSPPWDFPKLLVFPGKMFILQKSFLQLNLKQAMFFL